MYRYGMFSAAGNSRVHTIVKRAVKKNLSESEVYDLLSKLSDIPKYAEAMDTAVCECVMHFAIDTRKVPGEPNHA